MGKIRKQFMLNQAKIARARKILGAETDTQAVDEALGIVIANANISEAHRRIRGKCKIQDMDQSRFNE